MQALTGTGTTTRAGSACRPAPEREQRFRESRSLGAVRRVETVPRAEGLDGEIAEDGSEHPRGASSRDCAVGATFELIDGAVARHRSRRSMFVVVPVECLRRRDVATR
jgi:hypothetical protein